MSPAYEGDTSLWYTKRFKSYANRITAIPIECTDCSPYSISNDRYRVDESVLRAWSSAPGGLGAVFPRARRLSYVVEEDPDYYVSLAAQIIPLGLCNIHAEITAHLPRNADSSDKILRLLIPHTSNLQYLTLYCFPMRNNMGPTQSMFTELIMSVTQLQQLRTNIVLSPEAMLHLAYLPSLKVLLYDDFKIVLEAQMLERPEGFFQGLETLHLYSTFPNMTRIVSTIASRSIRTIQLRVPEGYSGKDLIIFLTACTRHISLKEINVIRSSHFASQMLEVQDVESIISTLQSMIQLRSLDITSFKFPILNCDLAAQFSEIFPSNFIYLRAYHLPPVPWTLFHRILSTRIWDEIPVGLYFVSTPPPRLTTDHQYESITVLHVAGNPGSNESQEEWAYILRAMFPVLQMMIIHPEEQDAECHDKIAAVSALMRIHCGVNWHRRGPRFDNAYSRGRRAY
jgi:hypothetical protein